MNTHNELNIYEKISWLIISETIFVTVFVMSFLVRLTNQSIINLLISIMLLCQIPAINFIIDYFGRRLNAVKRFLIKLLYFILIICAIIFVLWGLVKQTTSTVIGIVLLGVTIWLTSFPPKWYKKLSDKWKKK